MTKNYQKIDWTKDKSNKILQLYNKGIEYCLLSDKYEQCHQMVWCKDYLHDVMYATINNKPIKIFNFQYNPKKQKIPSIKKTILCIADNKNKDLINEIENCIDLLNKFEHKIKMKKSKFYLCKNPSDNYKNGSVFVIEGDKRWLASPPMISLYAMLIRIGFCHKKSNSIETTFTKIMTKKIKTYQPRDIYNFKSSINGMKLILDNDDRNIFFKNLKYNYPMEIDILRIHNYLGISNFSAKFGMDIIDDWYKNIKKHKNKKRLQCSQ